VYPLRVVMRVLLKGLCAARDVIPRERWACVTLPGAIAFSTRKTRRYSDARSTPAFCAALACQPRVDSCRSITPPLPLGMRRFTLSSRDASSRRFGARQVSTAFPAFAGARPSFCPPDPCRSRMVGCTAPTPLAGIRQARPFVAWAPPGDRRLPCLRGREIVPSAPVGLAHRAACAVQVIAPDDHDHHGHQPHPRMILTDRARSLVHWCDDSRARSGGRIPGTRSAARRLG
jgi:hypothetical protein